MTPKIQQIVTEEKGGLGNPTRECVPIFFRPTITWLIETYPDQRFERRLFYCQRILGKHLIFDILYMNFSMGVNGYYQNCSY